MQLIAARFCDHLNVRASAATVSCIIQARLDFELLNGVWIGNRDTALLQKRSRAATAKIIHVGSVHLEIVAGITGSVDVEILSSIAKIRRVTHIGHNTRRHRQDLRVVTGGKWELRNGTALNDGAQRGVLRLHRLRGRGNLHGLLRLAQNHLHVERAGFRHSYLNCGWHDSFEPCGLKSQFVFPRYEKTEMVTTARISLGHALGRCGLFRSGNADGCDGCSRRISHSPGDGARAYCLRMNSRRTES